jgi:hypothetical protein
MCKFDTGIHPITIGLKFGIRGRCGTERSLRRTKLENAGCLMIGNRNESRAHTGSKLWPVPEICDHCLCASTNLINENLLLVSNQVTHFRYRDLSLVSH